MRSMDSAKKVKDYGEPWSIMGPGQWIEPWLNRDGDEVLWACCDVGGQTAIRGAKVDAQRAVDCVNACAGWDVEEVEEILDACELKSPAYVRAAVDNFHNTLAGAYWEEPKDE